MGHSFGKYFFNGESNLWGKSALWGIDKFRGAARVMSTKSGTAGPSTRRRLRSGFGRDDKRFLRLRSGSGRMTNYFLPSKVDFSPAHNPRPAPVSSFAFPQYPVIMADVFQANEMIGATK